MTVHVSTKHKVVCIPANAEIENLFPEVKHLVRDGKPFNILPHGPTETFFLRKLGYDIPSPILTHYGWPHPIGQPPFDAQKKTSAMMTMNEGCYVLNDMGTGKTRAALWAWDYLRGNGMAGKLLVLAPLSTLNFVWMREIFNTLPHRKAVVLHGTRSKRLEKLADEEAEIYIINHDGLKVIHEEIRKRSDIDAVVVDELAVYRNGGAARTKRLRELTQGSPKIKKHMRWVWGMTGAPIPTSPTDAWAQATIVTPTTVPKYFGRFRDDLMYKIAQFKWLPKEDAVQRAFAAMTPSVRFTLADVTELPGCVRLPLDVAMGTKQAKVYKQLADHCVSIVESGEQITAANAGAMMMKLLQVSSGWVYAKDRAIISLDNEKRIAALIDAINATSHKVLVFVAFKHALSGISAALDKEGIEHACVSGDTSSKERSRIFTVYQNTDKYKAIVAHPQCLAHGVTLTAADTIIWFSPVTSLEIYEQANRRIRRVGQDKKQLILHLQSTPVEKRVYSILQKNQKVQDKFLDLVATATQDNPQT